MSTARSVENPLTHLAFPDGSSIVRVEQLPWTPWGMPGTYFKLLKLDDGIGIMVFLLKVDPNVELSPHKHFGNGNVYVLKGGFGYENGQRRLYV
jgi:anti-sigma factor ChrR (cupin superfamily)